MMKFLWALHQMEEKIRKLANKQWRSPMTLGLFMPFLHIYWMDQSQNDPDSSEKKHMFFAISCNTPFSFPNAEVVRLWKDRFLLLLNRGTLQGKGTSSTQMCIGRGHVTLQQTDIYNDGKSTIWVDAFPIGILVVSQPAMLVKTRLLMVQKSG